MTESQLVSAYHDTGAAWLGLMSLFMSVLLAYLVTAYLVGSRLGRSQMAIATGLCTVFSVF